AKLMLNGRDLPEIPATADGAT
ncbi:hypothetical protein LCGC14_2750310, partial [marine sediment metagenome]